MSLKHSSETFLIIGKIKRDTVENYIDIHAKSLSRHLEFSQRFSKNTQH